MEERSLKKLIMIPGTLNYISGEKWQELVKEEHEIFTLYDNLTNNLGLLPLTPETFKKELQAIDPYE